MTRIQELFLAIISAALENGRPLWEGQDRALWALPEKEPDSWKALCRMAKEQALSQLFYDYILEYGSKALRPAEQERLQNQVVMAFMMYYRMANFVFEILSLAKQEKIRCCILKGLGLALIIQKKN